MTGLRRHVEHITTSLLITCIVLGFLLFVFVYILLQLNLQKNRQLLETEIGEVYIRYQEKVLQCEDGEALTQAAQRSCVCPIPGDAQCQVAQGTEQPGLVEGDCAASA